MRSGATNPSDEEDGIMSRIDLDSTRDVPMSYMTNEDKDGRLLSPVISASATWRHRAREVIKYIICFWNRNDFDMYLLTGLIGMVLVSTVDSILYTRLSYKMVNYEWFLSQVVTTIGFCIISWPVVIYRLGRGWIPPEVRAFPHKWYMFIAVLDASAGLLATIPTPYIPGPLLVIIGKLGIPFTMVCSFVLLGVRYRPTHYIGAMLIGIGVIISVFPKMDDKQTFESNIFWLVMFVSAGVPTAFSNVYKEKVLKSGKRTMDIWWFNAWVALYQLAVGFSLAWTVFLPFPAPAKSISPREFPQYMVDATMCFFGSTDADPSDEACQFAWIVFGFFIVFNIAFNVLIFYVMQRGSATLAVIASTSTLALTSLGYHIPLLAGEAKVGAFNIYGVISLIVIIIAILVYKIHNEIPKKSEEDRLMEGAIELELIDTVVNAEIVDE